jgi:hypothetical protein
MKLSELIKQLNALKDKHGDVEAVVYNPEYAKYDTVVDVRAVYPGYSGIKEDETKPAWGVCVNTF